MPLYGRHLLSALYGALSCHVPVLRLADPREMLYSERMSVDGGGYGGGQRTFGLYLLAALRCARTKVVETAQHESVNSLYMELLLSDRMTIFAHSYIFISQKKR